jgi:hypothetical protein
MPADAFRDPDVGIACILEQFRHLECHPLSLKQHFLERGGVQGDHLLKVISKKVHDGGCVGVLQIGKAWNGGSAHDSTTSNSDCASQ